MNNVNFQLLLRAHNGDVAKAQKAWAGICNIGRFGNVPSSYEGGLDLYGARVAIDEGRSTLSMDDIKKIEDMASGDSPD